MMTKNCPVQNVNTAKTEKAWIHSINVVYFAEPYFIHL